VPSPLSYTIATQMGPLQPLTRWPLLDQYSPVSQGYLSYIGDESECLITEIALDIVSRLEILL